MRVTRTRLPCLPRMCTAPPLPEVPEGPASASIARSLAGDPTRANVRLLVYRLGGCWGWGGIRSPTP
eukprot:scaffold58147_cov31-Tisochrysis_lutea.AAC.1